MADKRTKEHLEMLKERNERKRLMDEAQERKERPRKQLEQGFNVYNHLEKKPAKKVAVKKHKTVQEKTNAPENNKIETPSGERPSRKKWQMVRYNHVSIKVGFDKLMFAAKRAHQGR